MKLFCGVTDNLLSAMQLKNKHLIEYKNWKVDM